MELTLSNLVNIIMGVLFVGVVVIGLYFFFKNYIFEFFKSGNVTEGARVILTLI